MSIKRVQVLAERMYMSAAAKVDPNRLQEVLTETQKKQESKLFEMQERVDLGKPDSMRYTILTQVLTENYDHAIEGLKSLMTKPSDYPNFHEKVERLISHGIDLIYAIKAKRNFPGLSSLTRPKQQELRERYLIHFRELQITLKRVEKVESDLRIADVRSTIYVVKALCIAAFVIVTVAFGMDIIHGLAETSFVVVDDLYTKTINITFEILGL